MTLGIVAALTAASTIAAINFVFVIAIIVWRCKRWKKSKPVPVTSLSSQPTILKRKPINISRLDLNPQNFAGQQNPVYTVPTVIQTVPSRNPISYERQSNRPPNKVWPPLGQFLTMNDSVMWYPVENATVVPARQQAQNSKERPEYLKRQRDPGFGSVEILPDYDDDVCY
uniref:Uncharacterized protein n=1 Tax=Octopus bimaculoides TaxID=37653 RepID=A0A0L8HHQ4_OCTBM|eukprot:XP_014772478.1 PREDICTED: uncharacterized protein LOC106870792 [Octopus bimaculoides]